MNTLKGKTALVTGASAGIGEAIARKLAAEGVNLVLVARSQTKLEQLASELGQTYAVRCVPLVADLSQPNCGSSLLRAVRGASAQIDILVNNAGFGTYGPFETISPETEQDEIAVNIARGLGRYSQRGLYSGLSAGSLSGSLCRDQSVCLKL